MTLKTALPLAAMASLSGCAAVIVTTPSGELVGGAEIFLDGQRKGATDSTGRFVGNLSAGTRIIARHLVYEHPSPRPDHGPGPGWVMRVYQTSRVVNNSGSVTDAVVVDPSVDQGVTVDPGNTLIGWHLVASLDWDASDAELSLLATRFKDASQYLYNLTDGQFFIEQVEIADDTQLWGSAEIGFQVDKWVWPHTPQIGGFLGSAGAISSHVYMSPFSEDGWSQRPHRLVHELGHLALGLNDEYGGVNAFAQNYCTAARTSSTAAPAFRAFGDRAACAMDDDAESSKLCSAHQDSAHRGGNWQPGPCWGTVAAGYGDPGPGGGFQGGVIFKDRWTIKTPDTRGAVVGTLPPLPAGLEPKITVMNRVLHDLCKPFLFVDPAGASAAGGTVWVVPSFWAGNFTVGRLDSSSRLMVSGVHLNDEIWSPKSKVKVTSSMCTIVQ
jgi:hypothetical protein